MVGYETLKAALDLLTATPSASTGAGRPIAESLSSAERGELAVQVERTAGWRPRWGSNVVAFGISEKRAGGGSTDALALTVYVERKYRTSDLARAQLVPPTVELSGLPEPVLTDVREIGALGLEALTSRVRPIICGYSIGHAEKGYTGTLACLVRRRSGSATERPLLLSNSHVLAKSGLARPGDPILQPATNDGGQTAEPVARLSAWQPFTYGEQFDNRVDAAVAEPIDPESLDPAIFEIGIPRGVRRASRGTMVQKAGRTTGHTFGKVDDVDFRTALQYPAPAGVAGGAKMAAVGFSELILCSRFTAPGDSGSLVLDADGYAVGLHFCGTPTVSVACPIGAVLDALDVELITDQR
jgi:hypothetical protein